MSFNLGTPAGANAVRVESADLANLRLTGLPLNSDADLALTLTPFSQIGGLPISGAPTPWTVTVDAVADIPGLTAPGSLGIGVNQSFALGAAAALVDADGSETLSIHLDGVPAGAILTSVVGGVATVLVPSSTALGIDAYDLTAAQLAGLSITPPVNVSGNFALSLTATASESNLSDQEITLANNTASRTATIALSLTPVSGAPVVTVTPANVVEDLPTGAVPLVLALTPGGPGLASWVIISNIPVGVSFNLGTPAGANAIRVESADLAALLLAGLPSNSDADFILSVTPFSQDGAAPPIAGLAQNLVVTVDAAADAPALTVSAASGNEDSPIALSIAGALADGDGSELLTLRIAGVPPGAQLFSGATALTPSGGVYTLTPAQLAGLSITPPANFNGTLTLGVTAVATETATGPGEPDLTNNVATTSASLVVTVAPVTDGPPVLGLTTLSLFEDLAGAPGGVTVPISLMPAAPGEQSWVVISNIPPGVVLSTAAGALVPVSGAVTVSATALSGLSVTGLPSNSDADIDLTVTPFGQDGAAPPVAGPAQTLHLLVDAVADGPSFTVQPASGAEDTPIALSIAAALIDTDGSEQLGSVTLDGIPSGWVLVSGGTTLIAGIGGAYVLSPAQLAGLTLTPPGDFNGAITVGVTAPTTETPTDAGESDLANNIAFGTTSLVVTVTPVSDTPSLAPLAGAAGFEDLVGGNIALPIVAAPGAPGETGYVVISGVPAGVTLNAGVPSALVPGGILLTAAQAAALQIIGLPANSDRDFTLTVTPFSRDGAAAPASGVARDLVVTIDAVADAPGLVVSPAAGNEDSAIALAIAASPTDADGSEAITAIQITGVPSGAQLFSFATALTPVAGIYTLTAAQLAGLTLKGAPNFSGVLTLGVVATSTETPSDAGELTLANNQATTSTSLVVTIAPVSDTPVVVVPPAQQIKEDLGSGAIAVAPPALGPLAIPIVVSQDAPGESAFIDIRGIPSGVGFNFAGTVVSPGVVRFTAAQAAALSITRLPTHKDNDFVLTVTPLSVDGAAAPAFGVAKTIAILVDAVVDMPDLSRADNTGKEDTAIPIRVTRSLVDTDGSETLTGLHLTGVPTGSVISFVSGSVLVTLTPTSSAGGFDVYDLTGMQAASARIRPPPDFNGEIVLGATLSVAETNLSGGEVNFADNATQAIGNITITVQPVPEAPGLALDSPTGEATSGDQIFALTIPAAADAPAIEAGLIDVGGSETLAIAFADVSTGMRGADRFVVVGGDAIDSADVIDEFAPGETPALGPLLQSLGGAPEAGEPSVHMVRPVGDADFRVDQNGAASGDTNTLLATIQNQTAAQIRAQTDFS